MSTMTFGRYSFRDTFVHRLDARNKIFLMLLFMVGIFFQFSMWSTALIMSGVYIIILLALMLISRVSLWSLIKSLGGLWMLVIFLMIIYIFVNYKLLCYICIKLFHIILYLQNKLLKQLMPFLLYFSSNYISFIIFIVFNKIIYINIFSWYFNTR